MFKAIKKKNAKFTAFKTTISSSGITSAVSISACPAQFRASLRILMTKTSSQSGKRIFQLWLRHLEILHHRLVFFKLFLSRFFVRQLELIQQAMERTTADAQFDGSPQPVSGMNLQRRTHQLLLESLNRLVKGTCRDIVADNGHFPQFLRQIRDPKIVVSVGQHNAAFDDVLQLADISGPGIARQRTQEPRREHTRRLAVNLGKGPQEVLRQQRDIFLPLTE